MTEFWKFTGVTCGSGEIYINKNSKILSIQKFDTYSQRYTIKSTIISATIDGLKENYSVKETIEEVLKIISSDVPMQIEDRYKDYFEFRGSEGMIQLVPNCWEVHTLHKLPNGVIDITFYDPKTTNYYRVGSFLTLEEVKRIVDWKGE